MSQRAKFRCTQTKFLLSEKQTPTVEQVLDRWQSSKMQIQAEIDACQLAAAVYCKPLDDYYGWQLGAALEEMWFFRNRYSDVIELSELDYYCHILEELNRHLSKIRSDRSSKASR